MTRHAGQKILIIDDDRVVRETIACYLEDSGFDAVQAGNGQEGLERFGREEPSLVLVDLRMPGVGGLEVLSVLARLSPRTPVIIVSGAGLVVDVVEALRRGAWDYVMKPITELGILEHAVRRALERAALLREKEFYQQHLEGEIARRTRELERELAQRRQAEERAQESVRRLEEVLEETVGALAAVVEVKDPYTSGHQRRVSSLACALAAEMGIPPDQGKAIRVAGLLHDIGKIYIPAEILSTPLALNDAERSLLRTHPQVGFELLKGISFEWPVAEIVLQHHERLDGSGYPRGLSGDEILVEARVLGVADVVEALSSHRPYRPAFSLDYALERVVRESGVAYDPRVVSACTTLFGEGRFAFP